MLSGYHHDLYWRRRAEVINPNSKKSLLYRLFCLVYVKRIDAMHHCSFGTGFGYGASFATPPLLPHGPNGIIVGYDASVGKSCVIYHQVTIAGGGVSIGDNVELGAGSKILPNVTIGHCCHVGANAVVVENIPDNSTVVLQKPRVLVKNE